MIKLPLKWVEALARAKLVSRPEMLCIDVPEAPTATELSTNLILREVRDGYAKWAHFRCPRCGEHIQLPIVGKGSWSLRVDLLRRPTLHPSVWQTGSCKAHFFVRAGRLAWCRD